MSKIGVPMNPVLTAFFAVVGGMFVAAAITYGMLLSAYRDYGLDRHGNPLKTKK